MANYGVHTRTHTGAWAPSDVVELVTRFARRLSQDVPWADIEELLVLINQVLQFVHACMCICSICSAGAFWCLGLGKRTSSRYPATAGKPVIRLMDLPQLACV